MACSFQNYRRLTTSMKRSQTPENLVPRKRPHYDGNVKPRDKTVLESTQDDGVRCPHFTFGNNDNPKEFGFRCGLPFTKDTQQRAPLQVASTVGRFDKIELRLSSDWCINYEGPDFALDAVLERLPLMAKLLSGASTTRLRHSWRGFD